MASDMYRYYTMSVFPVTYVHIGDGSQLDPTQYVIYGDKLYLLNANRFIGKLLENDPEGLKKALDDSRQNIGAYWSKHFDPADTDTWYQCHPVHQSFQKKYQEKLSDTSAQQLITSFITNPLTGDPYLPGSSLKGALRTAILHSELQSGKHNVYRNRDGDVSDQNMEAVVFNYMGSKRPDITSDPFKYLKIGDISFPAGALLLKVIDNLKANNQIHRKHNPQELAYMAQVLAKGTPGISGRISIDKRFRLISDAGDLAAICNAYFKHKLDQDRLYYRERNPKLLEALENTLAGLEANACLIRFGKGTGSIHKSINKQKPQTRSLIGGLALGICKLSFKDCT